MCMCVCACVCVCVCVCVCIQAPNYQGKGYSPGFHMTRYVHAIHLQPFLLIQPIQPNAAHDFMRIQQLEVHACVWVHVCVLCVGSFRVACVCV